jgi:uncharacterized oxidoreductase
MPSPAALHSFSISLRHQLLGTRVRVFEVMPPTVDTEVGKDIGGRMLAPGSVAKAVVTGVQRETHEIRMGPAKALYAVHVVWGIGWVSEFLLRVLLVLTLTVGRC